MIYHSFLSVLVFTTTFNIKTAEECPEYKVPKIIVVSDETARELLLMAIKDELKETDGLDAQILDLNFPKYEDAIEELEACEDDVIMKFYSNIKRRFMMLTAALS
jgi:hypothetical protein